MSPLLSYESWNNVCYLSQYFQYRNQVVSLLLEVPGHKMPLFTFRELFASRYLSSVSVSDLYRMRDVCIIVEEKNGRTITLNSEHRNTPSPASSSDAAGSVDLPFCVRHSAQLGSGDKGWAEQEQPSLANVTVRLAVLAERVTSLVQSHNNWLPLARFVNCAFSINSKQELMLLAQTLNTWTKIVSLRISNLIDFIVLGDHI